MLFVNEQLLKTIAIGSSLISIYTITVLVLFTLIKVVFFLHFTPVRFYVDAEKRHWYCMSINIFFIFKNVKIKSQCLFTSDSRNTEQRKQMK